MLKRRFRSFICFLFAAALVLAPLLPLLSLVPERETVYAANADVRFDDTDVLTDLRGSNVNGLPFNLGDYPFNDGARARVINFVEYCYSFRSNSQDNFGLYVYVYNPQCLNLSDRANKIQMATEYSADGTPSGYAKFGLQLCSVSTELNYYRLFYKFKIRFSEGERSALLNRLNSHERRYDVSGVELFEVGATNAYDYAFGHTLIFSGYASGYGPDTAAESNLACAVRDLEVVEVRNLRQTNFRTGVSSAGKYHQNDLNSVYFSIDDEIFRKYGRLQKILAEWYEYNTAPIVVTGNKTVYDAVLPYVGYRIDGYNSAVGYGLYGGVGGEDMRENVFNWAWNPSTVGGLYGNSSLSDKIDRYLFMLFYAGADVDVGKYTLPKETLAERIHTYDKTYIKGSLPVKDGTVSADLFAPAVDTGRVRGYNLRRFDADSVDDLFNLLSYDSNHSGWDKFLQFGFFAPDTDGDFKDVKPINYEITPSDLLGSKTEVSKRLLIDESEVDTFKAFYSAEKLKGKTTVLFRFAQTDYYALPVLEFKTPNVAGRNAFMAQESVFLDFDMIEFTFNKDGVYHVIPVVSSPIDVINAVTPPLQGEPWSWLKYILGLLVLIIVLILLAPVLPVVFSFLSAVFRFIIKVVSLPFKFIAGLVGKRKKETEL